MGRDLAQKYAAARAVFEQADEALGFQLSRLCFEGPAEQLKLTENTQPAILTVSVATLAVLSEMGVRADYVAGHSLGECSALVAAGSIAFQDAVRLVRKRGRCMQQAVPEGIGAMAALLGIDAATAEQVCCNAAQGQVVSPANLNTPSQVVIAGHAAAVGRAVDLAREAGTRKAVLLEVSAPFHCALMTPAQQELAPELDAVRFADLKIPLVNNWQAREIHTGADAREGLKQQIPNPVLWGADGTMLGVPEGTAVRRSRPGPGAHWTLARYRPCAAREQHT